MSTVKILNQSKSAEWYTPAKYIAAVREVLGGIELDPASCEEANRTVKADRYYSIADNGLSQSWEADTLFLNPPYGKTRNKSNQQIWANELIRQFGLGRIGGGILLVNACTGDGWFQPLWKYPVALITPRIRFVGAGKSPTKSNAFIYFGSDPKKFAQIFSRFGKVVIPAASEPLLPSGTDVSGSRDESQSNEQNFDTSERA